MTSYIAVVVATVVVRVEADGEKDPADVAYNMVQEGIFDIPTAHGRAGRLSFALAVGPIHADDRED